MFLPFPLAERESFLCRVNRVSPQGHWMRFRGTTEGLTAEKVHTHIVTLVRAGGHPSENRILR